MTQTPVVHGRERLGWAFVISGFVIFVALVVSIPLAIRSFLLNSTQPLPTVVQANQGTVRIDTVNGAIRATSAGASPGAVEAGSQVLTDNTATALVLVSPPENGGLLARIQVYGNTIVSLDRIDAPRYSLSDSGPLMELSLESGRLRLTVPPSGPRPFSLRATTPHGRLDISEPGQYSIEVTNLDTQVAVQGGEALVSAGIQAMALKTDQRAILSSVEGISGPLDTERNLVRNGDFSDSFEHWTPFAWNVELADQPDGSMNILPIGGEATLRIARDAEGHADVRLREAINQDVTDYESLRLLSTFRIVSQDLDVCGIRGSECPLFLRLNYADENGVSHTWQQGFYAAGQAIAGSTPDACVSCDVVQSAHQFVQLGQFYFYDVDIRAELARQGFLPPRLIESVALVASGHSFQVEVVDVALMARE